jgi:hypothetical protein
VRRSTGSWRASSGELLTLALLLASCSKRPLSPAPEGVGVTGGPPTVTVFISAEVRGYLGPCGCSESMRGGISRAAHQVAEARRAGAPVYLLDCGDGLFDAATLPEAAVPQQELKAKTLAAAWKAMGLTLRAPGPLDDARGADFRTSLGLPGLDPGQVRVFDGIGVISADTLAAAKALVPRAQRGGARFFIALVPQPADVLLRESLDAAPLHLAVSARSRDAFAAEESRLMGGATKVAQVQSKGRSLLKLEVHFRGDGAVAWQAGDAERDHELRGLDQRIELLRAQVNEPMLAEQLKALRKAKLEEVIARREALAAAPLPATGDGSTASARFVPLESSFPKDPAVAELERQYDVQVGELNLAWAREHGASCPPATKEKPGFTGTAACIGCHPYAGLAWQQTKHAKAYDALAQVGKQHHLDCVSCHVLGWQRPQGVCRIDQTENRREVGCESCHGPGSEHLARPVAGNMALPREPSFCVSCHDKENSPQFDFDAYRSKIVVPGHGIKLDGGAP